jgi:uncharacterized protein (TIGR02145 family)
VQRAIKKTDSFLEKTCVSHNFLLFLPRKILKKINFVRIWIYKIISKKTKNQIIPKTLIRTEINKQKKMMKRLLKFCIALLTLALVMSGCKEDKEKNGQKPDLVTETGNIVRVLEPAFVSEKLESIDAEDVLTFSNMRNDEKPQPGDIICSAPTDNAPYGFLYRVKTLTSSSGITTITTEPVAIEEAIEDGEVSTTIDLSSYIQGIYDEDGNPLDYEISAAPMAAKNADADHPQKAKVKKSISLKIGKTFRQGSGSISLNGNLELSNEMEFNLGIQQWQLQYLRFAHTIEASTKLTLSGALEGSMPLVNVPIAYIKLAPITILVAGVPVVIVPEIPIYIKVEANAKIQGEMDFIDNTYSITAGILYQNGQVSKIFEKNTPTEKPLVERVRVALSGEIKATVEPGVSFLLYNSKDASMGASIGLYAKAATAGLTLDHRFNIDPKLKGIVGAEASVKGKLGLFGRKLLDYNATATIFETTLYEASIFPKFTPVAISNITENSATAATTVQTPAYFNVIAPVSQYGLCWGTTPELNIATHQHTQAGALATPWILTPTLNTVLSNLESNRNYYVAPYYTNWFGTFYGEVKSFSIEEEEPPTPPTPPTENAVVINGIAWATRNVDRPGTFAAKPEDAGMFYQWNRNIGWSSTDPLVNSNGGTTWDSAWNGNNATTWETTNNVCPTGYRVPTHAEQESLANAVSVWTTQNGVTGRVFGTAPNTLFLPAAGYRYYSNSTLGGAGTLGYYWSSTIKGNSSYNLNFDSSSGVGPGSNTNRAHGRSVRCVAE